MVIAQKADDIEESAIFPAQRRARGGSPGEHRLLRALRSFYNQFQSICPPSQSDVNSEGLKEETELRMGYLDRTVRTIFLAGGLREFL